MAARKVAPAAPPELPSGLLTLDEVLGLYEFKGLTKLSLRRWIKAGKLPASKIGKRWFIVRADIVSLLMPKTHEPAHGPPPPPAVPTGGLTRCPVCDTLSGPDHQARCGT